MSAITAKALNESLGTENFKGIDTILKSIDQNLVGIATAVSVNNDTTTWAGIQKIVRSGTAPRIFPVGTKFTVVHADSVDTSKEYVVVAHNYFKSPHDDTAPTMTLMTDEAVQSVELDPVEAFYCATGRALAAGTYCATVRDDGDLLAAGTYNFTLTQPVEVGGQLVLKVGSGSTFDTLKVQYYKSPAADVASAEVSVLEGEAGTNLGTFGQQLNHEQRIIWGSNNYKESFIRQELCNSIWKKETKFSRQSSASPHFYPYTSKFDPDFLAVIGEVKVKCKANGLYEAPDSTVAKNSEYELHDKFFLPSIDEILGSNPVPYYKDATSTDCIKYNAEGVAQSWRLRDPVNGSASYAYIVSRNGNLSSLKATEKTGISVFCNII